MLSRLQALRRRPAGQRGHYHYAAYYIFIYRLRRARRAYYLISCTASILYTIVKRIYARKEKRPPLMRHAINISCAREESLQYSKVKPRHAQNKNWPADERMSC